MVIGTGGAGMGAAIKGAELGYQVCVVEAGTIGGTCVNIGCVPSKTLIRAAAAYHTAGHHPFVGIQTGTNGVSWKDVIAQKDQLVAALRQEKYVDVMSAYESNITFVRGRFGLGHHMTSAYAILAGLLGLYLGLLLMVFDNLLVVMLVHGLYDFAALVYLVQKQKVETGWAAG